MTVESNEEEKTIYCRSCGIEMFDTDDLKGSILEDLCFLCMDEEE
jgi:hypothetical protein